VIPNCSEAVALEHKKSGRVYVQDPILEGEMNIIDTIVSVPFGRNDQREVEFV
jgi:hypothetical protein